MQMHALHCVFARAQW